MHTNNLQLRYANEVHNYDVYPKVVQAGKTSAITIAPRGHHAAFTHESYRLSIHPWDEGSRWQYPDYDNDFMFEATPDADGCIRFSFEFFGCQQFYIRLADDKNRLQLSVFCVEDDLVGRYPLRGDLHLHTNYSDGRQAPAIVAANYRKTGYDFLAITDHHRYAPSLEAIEVYKDVPIELCLVPGEEVHPPQDETHKSDLHIIHFGGAYSINDMMEDADEHYARVEAYMDEIEIPACFVGSERYYFASCHWAFSEIRRAGGLGVFCHPYWISDVLQIPPRLTNKLMEHLPFDAFEVLGGESYEEQNNFQTVQYYEHRAQGLRYGIVGSTDSHNSINSRDSHVCHTLVFAPQNERESIINAIRECYSVAVDTQDEMPRIVGDLRLVRYGCFLLKEFFPPHDELCFEEGRAMHDYACGVPGAKETLEFISGRMQAQREKYFGW
ncbi:MAG: hypothetical protein FWB76_05730 [Oscillospiraceae bacterium]|nr:hypothetical protein [Oscillospiraceae bacterium]